MADSINDRLNFVSTRLPILEASPASFGLATPALTLLSDLLKDAQEAYQNALKARQSAVEATGVQNLALRAMATQQGVVFRTLKTFADNKPTIAQRDAVYTAAQLPVPSSGGVLPPPTTPVDTKADPNANGTVTVKWKATGNTGCVYLVFRKLAGNSTFTQIGYISKKTFVDGTVPAGTTSCQYQVQAVRGQQTSVASQPVSVQFGIGGAVGYNGNVSMAA